MSRMMDISAIVIDATKRFAKREQIDMSFPEVRAWHHCPECDLEYWGTQCPICQKGRE